MQAREPTVSKFAGRLVLESEKSAASVPLSDSVPENAGDVGDMPTEMAPISVPSPSPELKDVPSSPMLVMVCTVGVHVTVTGRVNGDPVAPGCVATMFKL